MARRHVPATVLVAVLAAIAWMVGAAPALSGAGDRGTAPSPGAATRATRNATIEPSRPATAEATAAERNERLAEVTQNDRRHSSRDGRPLDWLAVVVLAALAVTALASSMARRRHRRIPAVAFGLTPSRGPPLLLPS